MAEDWNPNVQQMLTENYNNYMRGRGKIHKVEIKVGYKIWEQFNKEIESFVRYIPDKEVEQILPRHLMFKSAQMFLNERAYSPYSISITELKDDNAKTEAGSKLADVCNATRILNLNDETPKD